MTKKNKTTGFIDEGEETTIADCEFHGFDVGIHSKGKKLFTFNNKFVKGIKSAGFWRQFWIHIILGGLLVTVFGGLIVHYLIN